MTKSPDGVSLPTDQKALASAIDDAKQQLADCRENIKTLLASEDPARGIFQASAIHEAKQRHMMLQYQHDVLVARLNRTKFI